MHRAFLLSNSLPWPASVDDMQALSAMDDEGLRIVTRLATTNRDVERLLRMARGANKPWGDPESANDLAIAVDAHLASVQKGEYRTWPAVANK